MRATAPLQMNSVKAEQSNPSLGGRLLQRKLTVGASNDPLEKEADEVAERVLAMPQHSAIGSAGPRIQRLSGQPTGQSDTAPASVDKVLASPGRPLEPTLRQDMERRFGFDFSQVRVHSGAVAGQSARDLNATAYTVGHNIAFDVGRYAPETREGRRLIAHELAHVVQQSNWPERTTGDQRNGKRGLSPNSLPNSLRKDNISVGKLEANSASIRDTRSFVVARDVDDEQIEAIEQEKLEITALLARCERLSGPQRDRLIQKVGKHANSIHEERLLAVLLAVKFKPKMKRADFDNTYHELLERLEWDQMNSVLDYVGKPSLGRIRVKQNAPSGKGITVMVDKQSINDVGMAGAPGSSMEFKGTLYVVVDQGVQFKTSEKGGPAARNNNPGNITVDDVNPDAWSPEIGAYRGRNTSGRYAIFPSYDRGRAGLIAWARRWARKNPRGTLLGYFRAYAPKEEKGNNPVSYATAVAASVSKAINKQVTPSTPITDILDYGCAMDAFVTEQEKQEGFDRSNVKWLPRDSPELPDAVRQFVGGFAIETEGTQAIGREVAAAAATE